MASSEQPTVPAPGPAGQSAGAAAAPYRSLCGGIDALVRGVRAGLIGNETIADRLVRGWHDVNLAPVACEASALRCGDRATLVAADNVGRWMLPAFMSGLREIRPQPELTADDALELASQLAAIGFDEASLERFQNWVWSGGAEGFEVLMAPSFVEQFNAQAATTASFTSVRSLTASRTGGIDVLAGEKAAAGGRAAPVGGPSSPVAIDAYARGVEALLASPEFAPAATRDAADDATTWATAEMNVVLAHPALREAYPPDRLARRLLTSVSRRCDENVLTMLTAMRESEDTYLRRTTELLVSLGVGLQIGLRTPLAEPESAAALAAWMSQAPEARSRKEVANPEELRRQAMRGLLERKADRDLAARFVSELFTPLGSARWSALLGAEELGVEEAGLVAEALALLPPQPRVVETLLGSLRPMAAAELALRLPQERVVGFPKPLAAISLKTGYDKAIALFERFPVRDLADALHGRIATERTGDWTPSILNRVVKAWLRAPLPPEPLVELVRTRKNKTSVRIVILRALAAAPEAQKEAARWRPTEFLLDPREMLQELRAVRGRKS